MLCSNQQLILQAFPFMAEEPPVLVDWLPWNHTFGGNHNYGIALYNGGTLYIDDGKPMQPLMQETLRNLREISPTIYFNVPRGFEELAPALEADAQLRETFFRRLRLMFYAGAGLPKPVADRLYAIAQAHCGERVGIYTGLGMTETAPFAIGTVRIQDVPGAIGNPAPGVTMKLVPSEGKLELRYAGPGVTPGYWRAPELTAGAFDEEGFFRSEDAVRFLDRRDPSRGFVFDGRIAEDFKLSTGTWVSVGPLRTAALVEGSPHVQDVVITGHDRDEVGLLIFPRLDSCRMLAGLEPDADPPSILGSAPVRAFFAAMLQRLCEQATGTSTRVTRALLLTAPPSIDLGEVTDKGSINQRVVLARRADAVDTLYTGAAEVLRVKG
jgi:feruloyl-CoA synthase